MVRFYKEGENDNSRVVLQLNIPAGALEGIEISPKDVKETQKDIKRLEQKMTGIIIREWMKKPNMIKIILIRKKNLSNKNLIKMFLNKILNTLSMDKYILV